MNGNGNPTRLQCHMAAMLALEQAIGLRLESFERGANPEPEIASLLGELREVSNTHLSALTDRLRSVAPGAAVPAAPSAGSALDAILDGTRYPGSTTLVSLYTLLNQAVIGYAVLLELCLRAADSWVREPGSSAELAEAHMNAYAATAQRAARLLQYTVARELEQEGQECQCTCPSCSLGVCLCAIASRRFLGMAWADAGPIYSPDSILMVKPRRGSAAAGARLEKGDRVESVDDKEIESIPHLQDSIRAHQPGEVVRLGIKHPSGEQTTVTLIRP